MASILVIDDDKSVRDTLRLILSAAGYKITVANDGNQGMEAFAEIKPDLVITDIVMPEKDGIQTIGDIRKLPSVTPIIAISGGGRVDQTCFLKVAQDSGANRTFAKPFDCDELMDAVVELLDAA